MHQLIQITISTGTRPDGDWKVRPSLTKEMDRSLWIKQRYIVLPPENDQCYIAFAIIYSSPVACKIMLCQFGEAQFEWLSAAYLLDDVIFNANRGRRVQALIQVPRKCWRWWREQDSDANRNSRIVHVLIIKGSKVQGIIACSSVILNTVLETVVTLLREQNSTVLGRQNGRPHARER